MDRLSLFYGLQTTALLAIGVITMLVGIWIVFWGRRTTRYSLFGVLTGVAGIWIMSFSFWASTYDADQTLFWLRTLYVLSTAATSLLFLFSLTFLPGQPVSLSARTLALGPNALIIWLAYWTEMLVYRPALGEPPLFGSGWTIFALIFAIYFAGSMAVFLFASRLNTKVDKTTFNAVLTGTILTFNSIFTLLFGAAVPLLITRIPWLSLMAIIGGLGVMALFVIQTHLLIDLRLIGIELAFFMALIIFLADLIVSAPSTAEFIFRLAVLALLVIYGALTTKSIIRETRRMRENEVLNERMAKMVGQIIESDRTKTKMVSLVAHQMRAPLSGINAYLAMAQEGEFGKLPPKMQEIVCLNRDALDRLMRTVDTFLGITKVELGKLEIYCNDTDIGKLINSVTLQMEPLAKHKGLHLEVHVPSDLPPASCDQSIIFNVIMNLVDNAIKYTTSGTITVSAAKESDAIAVRVTDTGIGLTKEDRERIFDMFSRGLTALSMETRGEGLGLYVVRKFIDAHHGKLIVESAGSGSGSTFGFLLPLKQYKTNQPD